MKPEHKTELKRIVDKFNSIKTTQYNISEAQDDEMELYVNDPSINVCIVPPAIIRYCMDHKLLYYFKHNPVLYKVVMHIF